MITYQCPIEADDISPDIGAEADVQRLHGSRHHHKVKGLHSWPVDHTSLKKHNIMTVKNNHIMTVKNAQ